MPRPGLDTPVNTRELRSGMVLYRTCVGFQPATQPVVDAAERSVGEDAEVRFDGERLVAPNAQECHGVHTLTTEDVATDGGILRMKGAQLDRFRSNPALLLHHDYRRLPIGRLVDFAVKGKRLVGYPRFHELTAESREAKELYVEGYLPAGSIGFRVLKVRTIYHTGKQALTQAEVDAGAEWVADEWELLEFSLVAVPADAGALKHGVEDNQDGCEADVAESRDAILEDATNDDAPEGSADAEPAADSADPQDAAAPGEDGAPATDESAVIERLTNRLTALRLAQRAEQIRKAAK